MNVRNVKARRDIKRRRARKHELRRRASEQQRLLDLKAVAPMKSYAAKLSSMPRNHAGFFEWPDKEIKEIGIAQNFFYELEKEIEDRLVSVTSAEDPPNVKIITAQQRSIGVEVTELVDQNAIEYQIKGDSRYHRQVVSWNKTKFHSKLEGIILRKDRLCKTIDKNYDEVVLVIFTDEPRLDSDTIRSYANEVELPKPVNINSVYILTGYEPNKKGKALIKLEI